MRKANVSLVTLATTSAVTALVLIIGIMVGSVFVAPAVNSNAQASTLAQTTSETDLVAALEEALMDVYDEALPSVVNIRVMKSFDIGDFSEDGLPEEHPEFFNQGGGSGFVWDEQGHIVTNDHVVSGATEIEVLFANDTRAAAEIIGTDPDSDLAVIKVDLSAGALQPLTLGDSDQMRVGQLAIAIGSPFGQEFTMTSGIVSAVGRLIRGGNAGFSIPTAIQTDAPINPGNSGGPLLDRNGEVIGINAQMASRTGASSGIGFAIPVNIAKKVVPALISGDDYKYAWLGISGGEVTAEMSEFRGLTSATRGAVVIEVVDDGPAATAGLQGRDASLDDESDEYQFGGDIITAIDGQPVAGIDDLISYLVTLYRPGDSVALDVIRADGSTEQLQVTLGERPERAD